MTARATPHDDPFPRVSARRTPVSIPQHLRRPDAAERLAEAGGVARRHAQDAATALAETARSLRTHRVALAAADVAERLASTTVARVRRTDLVVAGAGVGIAALCVALAGVVSMGVRTNAEAATGTTASAIVPAGRTAIVVGPDGDLAAAMRRSSIAPGDIDRIVQEARDRGVTRFAPGAVIAATLAPGASSDAYHGVAALELRTSLGRAVDFSRAADGQIAARDRVIPVVEAPLRIKGRFGQDVRTTLAGHGLGRQAVDAYVRIIGAQMSLADIARGDGFDVVVDRQRAADGLTRSRGLMYAGLVRQDGSPGLSMSEWTVRGRLAWFDAYKASHSIDNVQRPVSGDVTSTFGMRWHPLLHFSRLHTGLDYRAAVGTPILAAQSGWVETAGWAGGYGNQVKLRHGGGMETSYSHMSRIAATPGTMVAQGQVIGYAGATGLATGPHLHFEVIRDGAKIDPSLVTFSVGPQLRGADLDGYRRRLDALLALPVQAGPGASS